MFPASTASKAFVKHRFQSTDPKYLKSLFLATLNVSKYTPQIASSPVGSVFGHGASHPSQFSLEKWWFSGPKTPVVVLFVVVLVVIVVAVIGCGCGYGGCGCCGYGRHYTISYFIYKWDRLRVAYILCLSSRSLQPQARWILQRSILI